MTTQTDQLILSVLDQSPVRQGGTAGQALHETVQLAQATEALGYRRFWVSEHHNTASFAGTAPEILIGQIAAATRTIRVGSGGVMLTHYAALKVAETFSVLSSFYPGRIDLGIGRAPGSDRRTAQALSYPRDPIDLAAFPRQVQDLMGLLGGALPPAHPFAGIAAQAPHGLPDEARPDLWLLGSSDYSARVAAALGLPFAFADFFGPAGEIGPQVADLYRAQFRPSPSLQQPRVCAAVHVICAESGEKAHTIAASMRRAVARLRSGAPSIPLLPPDEAVREEQGGAQDTFTELFMQHAIEGDPPSVRRQLQATAARYGTNDLVIATNCYAFADRLRSYQLVAEVCGIAPPSVVTGG